MEAYIQRRAVRPIGTLNKIAKALNAELALVIDLTEGNK